MAKGPGRNAPCPCGSGRKYKLCCLPLDEAREREARLGELQPPPLIVFPDVYDEDDDLVDTWPHPAFVGVDDDAADDLWDAFETAEYDEQIRLFENALRDGELDSELAFEMLAQIQPEAHARGELDRFAALIRGYAAQAPTLYAPDAGYYASWLVDAALAAGRRDELPALLRPLVDDPVTWADELFRTADQLMYHGETAALVAALKRGWPKMDAAGPLEPVIGLEYVAYLGELLLLDYLEAHPGASADDPALLELIAPYLGESPQISEAISALLGTLGRQWQRRDFESAPRSEPRERRMWLLDWEWLGEVWRRGGIPVGRIVLALHLLYEYQTDRETKGKSATALLVPAHRRVDRFLGHYLNSLSWRVYRAAAFIELLPLYVEFLVARGLVDDGTAQRALTDLRSVVKDTLTVLLDDLVDPDLANNIRARWAHLV